MHIYTFTIRSISLYICKYASLGKFFKVDFLHLGSVRLYLTVKQCFFLLQFIYHIINRPVYIIIYLYVSGFCPEAAPVGPIKLFELNHFLLDAELHFPISVLCAVTMMLNPM